MKHKKGISKNPKQCHGPVEISKHTIERYLGRLHKSVSKEEAKRRIADEIAYSKLIALQKDGSEKRVHRGNIYVVKREYGKLVVITLLLSKVTMKSEFSRDFSIESVNFNEVKNAKGICA